MVAVVPARVRLRSTVTLDRDTAWSLCDALAGAERSLRARGFLRQAAQLGALFEALEARLSR